MKTVKFLSVLNTLGGTETIDRLFASQFCTTEDEASLTWFMLLMALSALQRQGSTREVSDVCLRDSVCNIT